MYFIIGETNVKEPNKWKRVSCGFVMVLLCFFDQPEPAGNRWEDIYEGHAGVLRQLLVVDDLLQQWLLERLSGAAPQLVFPTILSDHDSAQCVFGRRPGGTEHVEQRGDWKQLHDSDITQINTMKDA